LSGKRTTCLPGAVLVC